MRRARVISVATDLWSGLIGGRPARTVAAVAAAAALGACGASPAETSAGRTPTPTASTAAAFPSAAATATTPTPSAAEPGTALEALAELTVKGRAPKTGYDRELFGQRWADVDRNGCDTRNDILARDLTGETLDGRCVVIAGTLAGPYTGRTISFRKADASAVQIDHVVALSDAWQKGAQQWDTGKRLAFANDPLNLLAVDGAANASKGDSDAGSWLPPNRGYRCALVARQTAVKAKYGLWVTPAERDAITRVLSDCPDERLPANGVPTTVPAPRTSVSPAPPSPKAPASPPADRGTAPDYGSCKQAKANGAGPYVRGQDAEYSYYRDGDSDGVVCE
jgi:hypothetical protein